MNAIIVGIIGAILSLGAIFGYSEYQQSFGALPLIQSAQLAASPTNGDCLTTDGTNNDWATCASGGGGGTDGNWTFFNNSGVRLATSTNQVLIGGAATSTRDILQVYGAVRATHFTATSTTASSTFPNLLSTNSTTTNATSTTLYNSGQTRLGALSSSLVLSGSTGILSNYAGASCTNQAVTAISAAGAATCTTITSLYVDSSITPSARTITLAGTAQQITSSAGAQDLSANRTWTLSLPSHVVFPGSINFGNSSSTNATTTSLSVANTASTTALVVSNLNAASCDVKASTAGVLSCGTDATGGGGGTPDSKWATSTDNAIYPSGLTNSVIVGHSTQRANDCLVCVFATSTTGTLILASSTASFGGDFLAFNDSVGNSKFYVTSDGSIFGALNFELGNDMSLTGAGSQINLAPNGVILDTDNDGALNISSVGGTNDEVLTVNLDDTANTAVWSSSSGLNNIDWSAITKSTFTNASSSLFSTSYASSTSWFGGGLNTDCDTAATSKLLWDITTGKFSCGTDQNSGGGGTPDSKWATSTGSVSISPAGALKVGIGTTTPGWSLQLASSTAPQLGLSDGSATSFHWTWRSINSNLYLATSSPSTFATSSRPILFISSSGTTTISGVGAATSTQYVYSTGSGKGGSIILEDQGGGACTELVTKAGVLSAAVVTCPAE